MNIADNRKRLASEFFFYLKGDANTPILEGVFYGGKDLNRGHDDGIFAKRGN